MYTSLIILTILILTADGTGVMLNLPFKTYAQNIVCNGKDYTYRLNDPKLAGTECIAKVDYRSEPHANPDIKVETDIAEAYAGNLGNDWATIKDDARYLKHFSLTKEYALATFTDEGVKIPYTGLDKNEVVMFTQWEEDKEVEGNGGYIFSQ